MAAVPPALSDRDRAILRDLDRVRLLTGRQIERLHFAELANPNARGSARRRTMHRLTGLHLVTALDRRVGGVRAGSSGLVYALDARAYRQRALWQPPQAGGTGARVRRPWPLGWQFVCHTLAVSDLYVRLREQERAGAMRLRQFLAEPASWHHGVKPDAYVIYDDCAWEQHRWLEVDRATESLPTIRRKLARYLELAEGGDPGPAGVLPSVLMTVPDQPRLDQVKQLVAALPEPATDLIAVERFDTAFVSAREARPPP